MRIGNDQCFLDPFSEGLCAFGTNSFQFRTLDRSDGPVRVNQALVSMHIIAKYRIWNQYLA